MTVYNVRWEIDLEADTPEDAARRALKIQRNPESMATVFDVAAFRGWGSADALEYVQIDISAIDGEGDL